MGNKGLFPGVAVPLAFFCTLFFRHRKKSVSAPWDGQSQSAPESARHSPPGQGVCACGRTKGLSSGQTIGAARTAVRPACCLPELRVANRLRRLCPLGTRSLSAQASSCGSPFGAVLVLGSLRSPAGKKASIAHFGGGARYVARSRVGQLTHAIVRARSSPFSAVKMGGPFSLRCLSPLCSPAVGGGQAYPLRSELFFAG